MHFAFNSSEISANEQARLDSFIQSTPKLALAISGNTDSKGSDSYNEALSKKRADAVKNYLLADAWPENLLRNENAFGETHLLADDETDEVIAAANRRVEIVWEIKDDWPMIDNKADTVSKKSIPEKKFIDQLIADSSVKKGDVLILKNINFVGGMHRILPSSEPQLQSLLKALQDNPKLRISIEGHICCLPDKFSDGTDFETHTDDLSVQRAKAVALYLANAGINKKRIGYRGFGHSEPLFPFPENNDDERTANRRVEIRILDK